MATFIPKKNEKDVISVRIPIETLSEVDKRAALFQISRNEFINQSITFALANMEDIDKKE